MTAQISLTHHSTHQALYEQDYFLWLETTLEQLRQKNFSTLDLENLIEELEGLGRSEKRALESLLTRLLEHLFKIAYWESEREHNLAHWIVEVNNFRYQIQKRTQVSTVLKNYLNEIFDESHSVAFEGISLAMNSQKNLLSKTINIKTIDISLEQALDKNWFPIALDEY